MNLSQKIAFRDQGGNNPGQAILAAAAAAGAASEKAKQEGYDTTVQILAALTAGMAPSAAKGLAVRAGKILTPMPVEVNRRLSQYDLKGIPLTVVENLRKRVQSALDDGGVVDEEQLGRLIAYAKTNTRPTRASTRRTTTEWAGVRDS